MFQISLEAARVNAGMTQREVAEQMKVNAATIANWEKGKTTLKVDQFMRLCDIYQCPQDIIFLRKDLT